MGCVFIFILKMTAWETSWPTLRICIEHLTQMSDDLSLKNTLPPSDLKYSTKTKMLLLVCRSSCFNLLPHAMKDKLMPPPYFSVQLQLSKCRFGSLSCVSINAIGSLPRIDVRRGTVVLYVCISFTDCSYWLIVICCCFKLIYVCTLC